MPKLDEKKALFAASRLSGDEIRKALIESAELKYEKKLRLLKIEVVIKALTGIISKAQPKLQSEMESNLSAEGTNARLIEWLEGMRINGIDHPEFWEVCAKFLMRALRGELRADRQEYPSAEDSKKILLNALS